MDDSKKNENLLHLDKSSTKELASSTFEDSDAISPIEAFHGKTFVKPIQKEGSSNFTHPFMISTQTKATSEDKSEKGNNPDAFLSASSKSSDIASARDSVDVEKIENEDKNWKWNRENIGVVQKVTGDGNCGYCSFIGACYHTRRAFGVNLPQMRSNKQALLNMWKDLKKWCHKNHHLFIEGNQNQDKMSIVFGEDVYNPLFEFDQTLEDPSNTLSILELFDEAIDNGIYNECIEESDWFPMEDPYYYLLS